ncbi:protein kinase C and casein kinase substrate in neurons protein 1-like [Octopus sinensis]|uniref:Protein kinase C and casein kinase substrate in neurons protein 1-like n=1 Tax=Octopus sinensis TaxID=2607531 RepID=A0A6P7U6H8_9MOLL|nr:protein kinase C and casein kinase substrate in neurons protein 1-like [Octopus sinensis]
MRKAREEYDCACRRVHNFELKRNISTCDQGVVQDSVKQQEKATKLKKQQQDAKMVYIEAIRLVNERRECYSQEMMRIFESCQQVEKERIDYFSSIALLMADLLHKHNCVDMSAVYSAIQGRLTEADPERSLKYWFDVRGPSSPLPVFEFQESNINEDVEILVAKSVRHSAPAETCSYRQKNSVETNGGKQGSETYSPGEEQPVVALYDYEAGEGDELSFRAGL